MPGSFGQPGGGKVPFAERRHPEFGAFVGSSVPGREVSGTAVVGECDREETLRLDAPVIHEERDSYECRHELPAVNGAFAHASGTRLNGLPATPERVLRAIRERA